MFEACVTGRFVATHRLRRPDGSTEELHEHPWQVRVTYAGPRLDDMGVLVDFGALRGRLDAALAALHEQDLNHLPPFARQNPSAENVAVYVAEQLPHELPGAARLTCVEVEEAAGCCARYCPPPHSGPTRPCG
jgi:6-pyruvoyltetrahydropterin/6-carboxytetrahydropterin synthase